MAKNNEYDWLNDAFDDKKNEEEMERAKRSRNVGCLIVALGLIVVVVAVFVVSCGLIGAIIPTV